MLPLVASALLAGPAGAQSVPPAGEPGARSGDAELEMLEQKYLDSVVKARAELGDKYLAALQRLQDSLTQSGKLMEALLVKQERERTLEVLARRPEIGEAAAVGATLDPVFLLGPKASVHGQVKVSPANGALFNWMNAGTYAEWTLPAGLVPGSYEVILDYSVAEGEGGTFDVTLDETQELSGMVVGKGEWSEWRELLVGKVEVGARSRTLRVTATGFTNDRLMNLRHVLLAPVGTWDRIAKGEKIAPPAADDPAVSRPAKADKTFTEFKNARFVPALDNEADRFSVSDGQEEIKLRLYFVDVPVAAEYASGDKKVKREVDEEAAYFGIKPEESLEVGRDAVAYVNRVLAGQALTVYTRMEPEARRSDRFYGMVVVGGKPLATLLVENGYARVSGRTSALPNGTDAESYLATLKKAEETAKSLKRGAWGKRPATTVNPRPGL